METWILVVWSCCSVLTLWLERKRLSAARQNSGLPLALLLVAATALLAPYILPQLGIDRYLSRTSVETEKR